MSFAVTAWKGYATPIDQGTIKRFEFTVEMYITAANTDVDADIGDLSTPGTFWTAAIADVTYGTYGTALLAYLKSLVPKVSHMRSWHSEAIDTSYLKTCGAPALGNEYQVVSYTSHLPNLLFVSGGAPTSWKLTMTFNLDTSAWPLADTKYGSDI